MTPHPEAAPGARGRLESRAAPLSEPLLRRLSLALGGPDAAEAAPPLLAAWAVFAEAAPTCDLKADGHSRPGPLSALPTLSLPRRMFAGAEILQEAALVLGAPARLETEVLEVRERQGSGGRLVFVELERRLIQSDRTGVRERQTLVYREAGAQTSPVTRADPPPDGLEIWTPTEIELFRFSAATFNSHRIHYDLPYARDVEGYPGLVVHGPLTAARLLLLGMRATGGRSARKFRFRAEAPLFVQDPVALRFDPATGAAEAVRADGVVAVRAELSF